MNMNTLKRKKQKRQKKESKKKQHRNKAKKRTQRSCSARVAFAVVATGIVFFASEHIDHRAPQPQQLQGEEGDGELETISVNLTHGTNDDFFEINECDRVLEEQRHWMPTQQDWIQLRKTYVGAVGQTNSTLIGPIDGDAFYVPVYIDRHPLMNRGVFAKQLIPRGTLVWSDFYEGEFRTPEQYRLFLINIPRHLMCEVLTMWTYYCRANTTSGVAVYAAMDQSALMNAALTPAQVNLMDQQSPDRSVNHLLAARDIQAGEQLLVDYSAFVYSEGDIAFGMRIPDRRQLWERRRRR